MPFLKNPLEENFGKIFKEVGNSSFSLFVIFVQVYFRVYFNKLKCIIELVEDNYLFEKSSYVQREKLKIRNTLLTNVLLCQWEKHSAISLFNTE